MRSETVRYETAGAAEALRKGLGRRLVGLMVLSLLTLGLVPALGAQNTSAGADLLAIAALLIRDGNFARAETALAQVDVTRPDFDRGRYETLRGLLKLRGADYAEAETAFLAARAAGVTDPSLSAYLAQALFGQQKYEPALAEIARLPRLNAYPDLLGLKSQAEWLLGRRAEALGTLDRALRSFPNRLSFLQQKIVYHLELSLTQEAVSLARDYLERARGEASAYLTVGEALRRGREFQEALRLLEAGRLAWPQDQRILLSLAQTYVDLGRLRTAASLVERAAAQDPAYLAEAAELYRRTKQYDRALYLNSLLADTASKTRQRFSLLLESGRFEEALALEGRLERLSLLGEERLRYALAYASYQAQRWPRVLHHLSGITDGRLYSQALALRQALEQARDEPILLF